MQFYLDEDVVLRAAAAGRSAPLEYWFLPARRWGDYGLRAEDVEHLRAISPEEAIRRLVVFGATETEATRAVRGS
jgi:hypothetical protein